MNFRGIFADCRDANQAAPVNAPIAAWFQFGHPWRRVTDEQRYGFMSARPSKPSKKPQVIVLPPDALRALEHPDEPEAGESYFFFRGVQYVSTISPDVVRAGPSWIPSLPLPFAPDRAVTAARAVLRRIVKDDSAWPVTEITLQRLRNVEPERWFFVVHFTRENGPQHLQGVARIYVDFTGRVGTAKKVRMT